MSFQRPGLGLFFLLLLFLSYAKLHKDPKRSFGWAFWLACLSVVMIIAGFSVSVQRHSIFRVFLLDASGSFRGEHPKLIKKLALASTDLSSNDRCALLSFAGQSNILIPPCKPQEFRARITKVQAHGTGGTNLEQALEAALILDSGQAAGELRQIILITEGAETHGSLTRACTTIKETQVIHAYCPPLRARRDTSLGSLEPPAYSRPHERVTISIPISSTFPTSVDVELLAFESNKAQPLWAQRESLQLPTASTIVQNFQRGFPKAGLYRLLAILHPHDPDDFPQNNRQEAWLSVGEHGSAIILGPSSQALNSLIKSTGFLPFQLPIKDWNEKSWQRLLRTKPELIVIHNTPAPLIESLVPSIRSAVESDGVGLLLFGGRRAFAPGRYQGSKLEELLPVRSDPPGDPGRSLYLSVALDSSGSMRERYAQATDQALPAILSILRKGDEAKLMAFADVIRLEQDFRPPNPIEPVLAKFRSLEASQGTNLSLALGQLLEDLAKVPEQSLALTVLVTDAEADINDQDRQRFLTMTKKIGQRKLGAKILLFLIGDTEGFPLLDELAKQLSRGSCRLEAVTLANASDALEQSLGGSISKIREEVAVGRFPISLTAEGQRKALDAPKASIHAYNRVRPKKNAELLASVGREDAWLVMGQLGLGRVLCLGSSVDAWCGDLIQSRAGQRFLSQLPRLARPRFAKTWQITAQRRGLSNLEIIAENAVEESNTTDEVQIQVRDARSQEARSVILVPHAPGQHRAVIRVSERSLRVSGKVSSGLVLTPVFVPAREQDEFRDSSPRLGELSKAVSLTGGTLLPILPSENRPLSKPIETLMGQRLLSDMLALVALFGILWELGLSGLLSHGKRLLPRLTAKNSENV